MVVRERKPLLYKLHDPYSSKTKLPDPDLKGSEEKLELEVGDLELGLLSTFLYHLCRTLVRTSDSIHSDLVSLENTRSQR